MDANRSKFILLGVSITITIVGSLLIANYFFQSQPQFKTSGYADCIYAANCTIGLSNTINDSDILLVFIPGYSYSQNGLQVQSISDTLNTSFSMYDGRNWSGPSGVASRVYLYDSIWYGVVKKGGADAVTVTYSTTIRHSDPIVIDVTGKRLAVYRSNSAVCTYLCTNSIATSPTALPSKYLAAATAYVDKGGSAIAGRGWVQIPTRTYYMTGEYNINVSNSSTTFPFTTSSEASTWGDVGIVIS